MEAVWIIECEHPDGTDFEAACGSEAGAEAIAQGLNAQWWPTFYFRVTKEEVLP